MTVWVFKRDAFLRLVFFVFCALLLSGCNVQLYSGLTEQEANEMMHILSQHGISSKKLPGQEQTFTIIVDSKTVGSALHILHEYGYPRQKFKSMIDIFKREGMVSSPMEERVRFIFALSQELAETLSYIDGVVVARVHIVLPENNPLSEKSTPSAASVFIKHRPNMDVSLLIPRIKALVTNSIEGLAYDRVAVVLMDAQTSEVPVPSQVSYPSWILAAIGGGVFLLGMAVGLGIGGKVTWRLSARKGNGSSGSAQS